MKIFAISDLHLSFEVGKPMTEGHMIGAVRTKPMDLFGDHWANYEQRIMEDWNSKVGAGDIGIIAGDISWAMKMEEARADFEFLSKLNGTKIIVRGNHDYWWSTISKVRDNLPEGVIALQNDSVRFPQKNSPSLEGVDSRSEDGVVFCGTRGWKIAERRQTLKKDDQVILDREIIRFELSLQDAKKRLKDGDKLVAVFHFPPFNSARDESAFTKLCEKHGVTAAVYGHLHGKNCRGDLITQKNGVTYYLTSCDLLEHKVVEIFY